MRRDVGFYVDTTVQQVYQAYLNAAVNPPFNRNCSQVPYHTISFGINFSFKYNMNGGTCHIHLMPYGRGTAVNMRFSIAQAAGARYEKYANDLSAAAQAYLPVIPRPAAFNVNDFLNPANQVTPNRPKAAAPRQPAPAQQPAQPAPEQQAAPAQQAAATASFCSNCGSALAPNSRFCSQCGASVAAPKVCPGCQAQIQDNDVFCCNCGTRL